MTTVICRKCGGNHFTIKCGKEIKTESVLETKIEQRSENQTTHKSEFNSTHKQHYKYNEPNQDNKRNENKFSIKIKDLPNDMTQEEVEELMAEWGQIYRIKVNNYDDCSIVYVDFKYEVEADHFIKALNKTVFDNVIISVEKVI
jgi:RNA recognition motif-containing protein